MDAPLSIRSIVTASPDQISCPLGEESAILNIRSTVYYGLNPVGARVWNLLQHPKTVQELRDTLIDEYDVERENCERDLLALLEKLRAEGLIHVRDASSP
jgi:Coenzyme PQQ synthesis protein D (PqqD)